MSTAPAPISLEADAIGARARRVWAVIVAHGVIDWLSAAIVPILTYLEGRVDMTPAQGALLLAVGSVSSGVIQPVVALVSDKHDTRWAGTLGLVLAALAMGSIGFAETFTQLLILQIIGTAGIGAFHPVGAAAAGHLAGGKRSSVISVFYAAGLAGGVLGAFTMPLIVKYWELKQFAWVIAPCLAYAMLLGWAIHAVPHTHASAKADHGALPESERRRRWRDVTLLFSSNAIRFIVNMMLVQLIKRWCETYTLENAGVVELTRELRIQSSSHNGPLQAMMAVGMGVSGLALGRLVPLKYAKMLLIGVPIVGVIAAPMFGRTHSIAFAWVLAAMLGVGYAAVMPLTIAMAQRLLPHRTSLASALMMGGPWSLAAIGPPGAQWLLARGLPLERAFDVVAVLVLLSSILCLPLGRTPDDHRTS